MLCIFIDALNPRYLEYMPFLSSLKEKAIYGELETPMAFTGISASFFTGLEPKKHKIVDLFELSEKKQSIRNKHIVNLIRIIEGKRFLYTPLEIERDKAKFFKPAMERIWPQKDCLKEKTLFDILSENKKSFMYIDWPHYFVNRKAHLFVSSSDQKVLELTKKAISKNPDFIFTHFLGLEMAHKTGINSAEIIEKAWKTDKIVQELCEKYRGEILIFSDHSMNNIKREINLEEQILKLSLRFGKDVVYFMGSTMARFWFKNENARKRVMEMLKTIKDGKILQEKDFNLPKLADITFLANTGVVFWPNFFLRGEHFKAMHGWNTKEKENKTFYLIRSEKIKKSKEKSARMEDMLPTMLKLMNLPKINCDGKALV